MENPPSTKGAGDVAREIGKTIVSAIPTFGGPLQVLSRISSVPTFHEIAICASQVTDCTTHAFRCVIEIGTRLRRYEQ